MKNIVKAITGSGLLISGSILIGTYQNLNYKLAVIGFMLACAFIIGGIVLLIGANANNSNS